MGFPFLTLEKPLIPPNDEILAVEYIRNGRREFILVDDDEIHNSKSQRSPQGRDGSRKKTGSVRGHWPWQHGRRDDQHKHEHCSPDETVEDVYTDRTSSDNQHKTLIVKEYSKKRNWLDKSKDRILRYFLPDNYSTSVREGYMAYTKWRLSAFFWGGCVGVFSTQGLLMAVGVGRASSAPLAAAVQWVARDGMGRFGRILFSQVGAGFDAETKQYRLIAALVLNFACIMEAVTPFVPNLFLPMACVANMIKGSSTVAAASTRGAIYKSFMLRENLGDITAKQETVGVAGDLAGTAVGVWLSRMANTPRKSIMALLVVSLLHLYSAYREIKSMRLDTLNRQRAHMVIKQYIQNRTIPSIEEVNKAERVMDKPWIDSRHAPNIELGARLYDAAPDSESLTYLLRLYKNEKYILTYEKERLKVILRSDCTDEALKAFFQADYFWQLYRKNGQRFERNRELLEQSLKYTQRHYAPFLATAKKAHWSIDTMLFRSVGRRVQWGNAIKRQSRSSSPSL